MVTKTYIPRGLWGQWAAGFTDPLYRGGGSGWQGLAGLAVVLCVEGVSQWQGLLDWELDFVSSVEVPVTASAASTQLLHLTRGLKNS